MGTEVLDLALPCCLPRGAADRVPLARLQTLLFPAERLNQALPELLCLRESFTQRGIGGERALYRSGLLNG